MFEKKINIENYNHIFRLIRGDITDSETDAIVNAANRDLKLGAGVAGAIREKGGPQIQQECDQIGRIQIGEAVITTGGKLKAKNVIHAVGPVFSNHSEAEAKDLLKKAVINSLQVLEENNLNSITFPAISTGIYGFPKTLAADVMLNAIMDYLSNAKSELIVQICLYSKNDYEIFLVISEKYFHR